MFKFTKTQIPEVIIVEPQVFWDNRGFFMETYSKKEFNNAWIFSDFVQDNHSKSSKWVLRWLHFQTINSQAKLVRVITWSVYDVVVDLRKDSSTYWKWIWEILSAENKKQLYIPKGFAHGFLTLEDNTEFIYKCDDYYNHNWDWGIYYNDSDIWINWNEIINKYKIEKVLLSKKDKNHKWINNFYTNNPF
jgi:dTDP-4-dehydrorhamnose 3,5-epimerase